MSCGVCAASANWATVTATFNAKAAGALNFGVTVNNGVAPNATGNAVVTVLAAGTGKAPTINSFTATPAAPKGGAIVTLTAVGNANPTAPAPAGTVTFSFTQTGGPAVTLSAITKTGTAPALQTAKVTFNAPNLVTKTNLTFQVVETNSTGVSTTSGTVTVAVQPAPADVVTITSITYRPIVSRVGAPAEFGKFGITAFSTAVPAPVGMTMTATLVNNTLPATTLGSTALPIKITLLLTGADPVGTLVPVCGPTPCWTTLIAGVIADTSQTPAIFVAPTSVTVTSSLGGTATMLQGDPLFIIR